MDVLSLHCPLTEENARMINADTLSRMKPGAWLINTARGGLLDEAAVLDALQRGQLGGVALDVLAEEPPVAGHPLLAARHPMLLVTPHCAWGSRESRQRAVEQAAGIIAGWRDGRLVNCVNPPLPLDNPKT